jgi:alcohol-forming fatty acyl-CoA reductase
MISINEFYRNRDVFITGATGLVGKVLIEKLLRSCPDLNRIFILMREKHSKKIEQRLEEMKNIPVRFPFPFHRNQSN